MSQHANECGSPEGLEGGDASEGGGQALRLLRYSHIFASAVREVLEVRLLREVSPVSLTLAQFHLLKMMSLNGRHQVGEIADLLGVSSPAATKNVDKLERLGLAVRTSSKGDRRASFLSVSAKGRRLVRKYEKLKTARMSPVLETFKGEEIEQLANLLERFSVSLLDVDGIEEGCCLLCAAYIASDCSVGRRRGGCPYYNIREGQAGAGAGEEA